MCQYNNLFLTCQIVLQCSVTVQLNSIIFSNKFQLKIKITCLLRRFPLNNGYSRSMSQHFYSLTCLIYVQQIIKIIEVPTV